MAKVYTPIDGKAIMQELVRQGTAQKNISVTDISSFMSAGETLMSTGIENVFNTLSLVIARTIVASRGSRRELSIIQSMNTEMYSNRLRKISFYAKNPLNSGMFNTDIYTNLKHGFTAGTNNNTSTHSQWEQNPAMPFEMNFGGSTVWDECITNYEDQIKLAFRGPDELASFVAGYMQEHANDIIRESNAYNRLALLSRIGSSYYYGTTGKAKGSAVNLTELYNSEFGTSYTSEQLRTVHLSNFLAFMVAVIKEKMDFMREDTTDFHVPMTKTVDGETYSIIRKTPYELQRLVLFNPLFRKAEALVLPQIFNTQYLNIDTQYERVNYWQSNFNDETRSKVSVNVSVFNPDTGLEEKSPNIEIPYVVGILFDRDSCITDFQLERASTTPLEARKMYRNTWLHFSKNSIVDPTENAIVFYMQDAD